MDSNINSKYETNNSINNIENQIINDNNTNQDIQDIQVSKNENNIKENKETKTEDKKDDNADDYVLPVRSTIRRSNSIKLYKRQHKNKIKKESAENKNIENSKDSNIYKIEDSNSGTKRTSKNNNKKVVFLPNFLTIIDVESYKKFNEENTCKDPFENIEILNGHINFIKKDDDESDGKARVQCSCDIF